jgi:hypothetical protein
LPETVLGKEDCSKNLSDCPLEKAQRAIKFAKGDRVCRGQAIFPPATIFIGDQSRQRLSDGAIVAGAGPSEKGGEVGMIQHTVRYTELAPTRFKDFWR